MGTHKDKETITVESLLRIKRSERPDGEFWDSFENSFQSRRLNALVERESNRSIPGSLAKFASYALPVFLVAGLAFFWSESQVVPSTDSETIAPVSSIDPAPAAGVPEVAEASGEALPALSLSLDDDRLASQFVVDAIEDTSKNRLNFRKVLYTPAIHLSAPSGSFYVKDSFSSRNYNVTTADVKLGRNF